MIVLGIHSNDYFVASVSIGIGIWLLGSMRQSNEYLLQYPTVQTIAARCGPNTARWVLAAVSLCLIALGTAIASGWLTNPS